MKLHNRFQPIFKATPAFCRLALNELLKPNVGRRYMYVYIQTVRVTYTIDTLVWSFFGDIGNKTKKTSIIPDCK